MSTEITTYVRATLAEKRDYVQTIAQAGELLPKGLWHNVRNPDTNMMEQRPSPGKVMLVVETGLMLGVHPMAALQGIDVIEGHPTIKPALMSALLRQAGHSLRIRQTGSVRGGDLAVTTTLIRKDDPEFPYEYTWTPQDAVDAGLLDSYAPDAEGVWRPRARSKDGKPLPWELFTARLCRWRSLSDAASAGGEDVLMGLHYTAEELGATVDSEGAVVEAGPAEPATPARAWSDEIAAATTHEQVEAVLDEARASDELTDALRTAAMTRHGMLGAPAAEPAEPDVEPIPEVEPEPVVAQPTGEPAPVSSPELSDDAWFEQAEADAARYGGQP
ncbi:hypothetical protein [Curtobacterium sp. UCD-KPL2560]|uniref:hypothetical protein n=1 Tax=Curtobacterium sp. UCD-KPL2560 TaxID=1885315 RepID=UPI000824D729|nr:hypothetical protein [Curtobacterium sp. UCD-KPL2560]